MDTATFLNKVLAKTGNYVLTIAKPKKVYYNRMYDSFDKLLRAIEQLDRTDQTVYYAVGTFENNVVWDSDKQKDVVQRKQDQAAWFKTLAVDIDVGGDKHKYQDIKDAARAVLVACTNLGLPEPMLVRSGNGLHVYWPFTLEIRAIDWERLSMMLANALTSQGVDFDTTKIHDRSMVLRPVGTNHKKNPDEWKEVKCVQEGAVSDPRDLVHLLSGFKEGVAPRGTPRRSAISDAILNSNDNSTPVILDSLKGCKQIDVLRATAGREDINGEPVLEPLWRASLGIAKYCDDPKTAIIKLASGHPDFLIEDNLRKLESWRGTGPTTCAYFEQVSPKACEGCKHKGKITSPAQLSQGAPDVVVGGQSIPFPKGYSHKNGWIVYRGKDDEEDIPVSPYLIVPKAQYTDVERNGTTVKLEIHYPVEGPVEVEIDHTALATDGKDFNNFLYGKQLWLPDGQTKRVRNYIVSYLKELKASMQTSFMYEHYGWQRDGSFLTNDGLIGGKGNEDVHYIKLAAQLRDKMGQEGDFNKWIQGTQLFDHPDLKYHGFVFLLGLSGPLMVGSGVPALFVNMYSPDSGSGKTLTGSYALSAWGNPEKLFLTVRDTEAAIYKRLGTMSSTGAYIDEITMIELDRLRSLAYALSEGREKIRGTRSMKELQDPATWNMPVLASSNQDLYSLLDMRMTSEAEKMRILQFQLDRVPMFNKGGANIGYKIMHMLKHNYGHAGPHIAKSVMANGGIPWVKDTFAKHLESFSDTYGLEFRGPERFIQAGFVCVDIIGKLAEKEGIIKFDYRRQIENAVQYYSTLRNDMDKTQLSSVDTINQYLLEHSDQIVLFRDYRDNNPRQIVLEPVPKSAVARLETAVDDKGTFVGGNIILNRVEFRTWCRKNGIDSKHLVGRLNKDGVRVYDNERHSLFKGVTGMGGVGQSRCLRIDMASHAQFVENGVESNGMPQSIACAPRLASVK